MGKNSSGPTMGKMYVVILRNSCFFNWQLFHLLYFMFKHTMFVAWNIDKNWTKKGTL